MKKGKKYQAQKHKNLLIIRAAVGGYRGEVFIVRLLVDTGASYTILPTEMVEALGCDIHQPIAQRRIVTAQGIIIAPVVSVPWFHCLGKRCENFVVVAHTLPAETRVDGLLGMDFLSLCKAILKIPEGEVVTRG